MTTDPLILSDASRAGPLGRLALIAAAAEIGVAEVPPGSNRGPRVEVYQRGVHQDGSYLVGLRWCARFARWCFERGTPSLFRGWGDLASAAKWERQAKLRRCWVETPAPGRVAIHLRENGTGHVAIVARVTEDDGGEEVVTIGGNEADAVRVVTRPVGYWSGFVELG